MTELARGSSELREAMQHHNPATARDLLRIPAAPEGERTYETNDVLDAITAEGVTDKRATVIGLGVILGAFEEHMPADVWQNAGSRYYHQQAPAYLRQLIAWGYDASPIEKAVVAGEHWGKDLDWSRPVSKGGGDAALGGGDE